MQRVRDTSTQNRTPHLSPERSQAVKKEVDAYLDALIDEWYQTVPYAGHLNHDKDINPEYYRRTLIEHCWRIRLMRSVQSYNLYQMSKVNKHAAKAYAEYEGEEMLHDELFLRDALAAGLTREQIYGTEPALATKLLVGYQYYVANHEKPLGVVCYSYLVEYTTRKLTPKIVENLQENLGSQNVKGQLAHLNTDLVDDHEGDMWNIIASLIESDDDIEAVKRYCKENQEILKLFFVDLYRNTVEKTLVPA